MTRGAGALCSVLLSDGVPVRLVVLGTSMHPTIRSGETVTIAPLATGAPKPGTIVLHRAAGQLVAHRVERRLADGRLLTRGDALVALDPPVAPGNVLGVVVAVVRGGQEVALDGAARRLLARCTVTLTRVMRRARARMRRLPCLRRAFRAAGAPPCPVARRGTSPASA